MLKIENLTYSYDRNPIIAELNLEIKVNSSNALLGANGSGKSTLGKILAGIIRPDSGKITIDNQPLDENSVAIVFQNPDQQFVRPRVYDDIAFGLENKNMPIIDIESEITAIAKLFEIDHLLRRNVSSLSGGEKQRVAIVSSLILNHRLLILDEATDMLDPITRDMTIKRIIAYSHEHNITLIFITHDMELAFSIENLIIISEGKIVANSHPNSIFHNQQLVIENRLQVPDSVQIIEEVSGEFCFIGVEDFKEKYEFKS